MKNNNCCNSEKSIQKDSEIRKIKLKPKIRIQAQESNNESYRIRPSCSCGSVAECSSGPVTQYSRKSKWITGELQTPAGIVPQVSTQVTFDDITGRWKARWGINRMDYKINPGLYAAGTPDNSSPVLVTANYKMSFDLLRKEITGLDAWILVLDTKGINVWCAAGKGTFGTNELITRIAQTKLPQIVSHKTLILPQLGAPGVSAHEVTKYSGFKVVYGPVRAKDVKKFINSGMKADKEMRTVRFGVIDRLVLTPIELVGTIKATLLIFGILFLLNVIGIGQFGLIDFYAYIGAIIIGCVLTPVLLPWVPGRAFAWKGYILGLFWAIIVDMLNGWPGMPSYNLAQALGYLLVLPSVSAFFAMNFTGASAYTSLSGVIKEMKIAVPAIVLSIFAGIILIIVNNLVISFS